MDFNCVGHIRDQCLVSNCKDAQLPADCLKLIYLFDQLVWSDQVDILVLTQLKLQIREVQNGDGSYQTIGT